MYKKLALVLMCLGFSFVFNTGNEMLALSKKKKKQQTEQKASEPKKKVSIYDKTFKKNTITARAEDGFMTVHKNKGKIYLELPVKYLGKEMLIASTISGTSAADLAAIGYKPTEPLHVRFEMRDSTVLMSEVSALPDFDREDNSMSKAVMLNSLSPIINSFKVTCYSNDSSAVVFDASSLFVGNNEKLAPVKSGTSGAVNLTATFNSGGSVLGDIKAFKDNVTIKSMLSYNVSATFMQFIQLKNNQPFTVSVTRTILLIPEKKMRPRMADSRLGIFLSQRTDLNPDGVDGIERYSVLKRWDVQPSDSAAWTAGKLVEPIKPIVFYIDDAFPDLWKEPIRKAVLRWNPAFEKIGFKNVLQVKDFPKDDPDFDPDNLKYSCIRYVPSLTENAMGPSWCDPATGEIFNASVIVYNDVIRLINNWRFTQTSQIDPSVRGRKMPEEIVKESIEYVIAHEIGHTLGFMHNMAASASYPVDSLRNPKFTAKYGTTSSIMDYARFNYVAQPQDKGVGLTPPDLGAYDYFMVKYSYKPVLEAKTPKEEAAVLKQWVDEKAGDKKYRYGRQQVIYRYDPSAIEEDLGDDPVKASDYGVNNLKYILSHFNEWTPDSEDPDGRLREARYEALSKQYNRYLRAVMLNIGGIYLKDVNAGSKDMNAAPVEKSKQRESLKWTLDQLMNCGWIADRNITDRFPLRVELPTILQYYTALELFNTYTNVILSSHVAKSPKEAYSLRDWANDMYKGIWDSAIKNRKPNTADKIFQNLYANFLTGVVNKKSNLVKINGQASTLSGFSSFSPSADHIVAMGLDKTGLVEANIDFLRELELEKGIGYVASQTLDEFGRPGYGWQYKVNLRTIDDSKTVFYGEILKIEKLLKSAIASSSGEVKTHYQSVLYQIESAMERQTK